MTVALDTSSEARTVTGVLEARAIVKRFGGLAAVDDVSLVVVPGQITSLIGPNGAGKTTLFNCLTGVNPVTSGHVLFEGRDITNLAMHKRAQLGIGRTFQRLEVFVGMSVEDNLLIAAEAMAISNLGRKVGGETPMQVTNRILDMVGLNHLRDVPAGELSTGTLRLVELGRALCLQPSVLLLDEPGSGLDGAESKALEEILVHVKDTGVGILLVEHDVELVMAVSQTIYVVDFGRLIAVGDPAEIAQNPQVRAAYLGAEIA